MGATKTLILVLCLLYLLKHHRRVMHEFHIWMLTLQRKYYKAGKVSFNARPQARWRSISLLTRAANKGNVSALVDLGKVFEQADDPKQATVVYNVLSERSNHNPWVNAYANERLEILHLVNTQPQRTPHLWNERNVIVLDPPPVVKTDIPTVTVTSDAHNVHDSGVTKSLASTYNRLKKGHPPVKSLSECLVEVRKLCESQNSKNALKALDTIEQSSTGVTALNDDKEVNVLHTVWNRLCTDHGEEAKNILVSQLADCVHEDGYLVCTSGRVARLVDTLSVIDPLVTITPRWATRRELLDLAATTRAKYTDTNTFKAELRSESKKRYVDTGLITQAMLDAELNTWIDNVD